MSGLPGLGPNNEQPQPGVMPESDPAPSHPDLDAEGDYSPADWRQAEEQKWQEANPLPEGEQPTVFDGGGYMKPADTYDNDGDGYNEAMHLENEEGQSQWSYDYNENGYHEYRDTDTDGDGYHETHSWDYNEDGSFDSVEVS
jgi:hypothetical protein